MTATAHQATELKTSVTGQYTLQPEALLVPKVTPSVAYTNPGGSVDVTAGIESTLNEPHQVSVLYVVTDANGDTLFTSTPVTVTLGITSGFTNVDLGSFDTTGFALGVDTITLTAVDQSGQLPTATGTGAVTIGQPVTATLTTTPALVPTGSTVLTNTLQLTTNEVFTNPLTFDAEVNTTPQASTIACTSTPTPTR